VSHCYVKFDFVGGQIGPEKIVDDGNLIAFIITSRIITSRYARALQRQRKYMVIEPHEVNSS
jgi:hypothetical protein